MNPVYYNFYSMGTRFEMVFPGIDEVKGKILYTLISKEVNRLQDMLSNYDNASALSEVNEKAFNNSYHIEDELFELFTYLKEMQSKTLGFYDPAYRNTINSYCSISENKSDISSISSGFNDVILNPLDHTICFIKKSLSIDSGGFGKGYALEKVEKILFEHHIHQAFISFGESSLMALGDHPFGTGWKIGIPDLQTGKSVATINIKDACLSVSGNSPNNRKKYPLGHIVNPHTGKLVSKPGIVCVTSPSAMEAEILSTALFASGEEKEKQILKNFPDCKVVRIEYDDGNEKPIIKNHTYINE